MLPSIKRIKDITAAENASRAYTRARLGGKLDKKDCATCAQTIWINVFFDGTGNNFREDQRFSYTSNPKARQSNIAKLAFFGWPEESQNIFEKNANKARYRIYVPGVGTAFLEIGDTGNLDSALGNGMAAKGEDRLNWALKRLMDVISVHAPLVKKINVSIFGFSRGATLARAFAHMLGKQCKVNGNELTWALGCNAPLEIYFMGILDTVASVGYGGSVTETNLRRVVKYSGIPGFFLMSAIDKGGHFGWASDLSIPEYVTRCVHYVAAHEVREKFPGDSVRRLKMLPSNTVEVFYPGMHSDIGGGYLPSSQEKRTNELAAVALNNLYREAWISGVPLRSPADIEKNYPGLFDISPELEACFNEYIKGIHDSTLEKQVIQHMDRYFSWRASRLRRLDGKILRPDGGVDSWMAITDKEFNEDIINIAKKKTGYVTSATERHEDAIYDEYHAAGRNGYRAKLNENSKALFDRSLINLSMIQSLDSSSKWRMRTLDLLNPAAIHIREPIS